MSCNVSTRAKTAKSRHCRIRNQNTQIGNQISPVMQKVRSLLPDRKSAQHLAILTDWPLSTCQKLLCGQRRENSEQLADLLRSEFGREVLFVVMGDASPDWFSKYRKQLNVNAVRRQLIESQRAIDALQMECSK